MKDFSELLTIPKVNNTGVDKFSKNTFVPIRVSFNKDSKISAVADIHHIHEAL